MASYLIHDNGARPFQVNISTNQKLIEICAEKRKYSGKYDRLLKRITNFQKLFVGHDFSFPEFAGNSLLVQITNHDYIFIGWEVYSFNTTDVIREYYSPVGNSDVPYPYAVGDQYIYLMIENVYMPKTVLNNYEDFVDPYEVYYFFMSKSEQKKIKENNKMTFRILIERVQRPLYH